METLEGGTNQLLVLRPTVLNQMRATPESNFF